MSSEGAYVSGIVRWLIVATILGLVLVAAFWRPESFVQRVGPLGIVDQQTWVEAAAYGALTLAILYALFPGGGTDAVSPLFVPVFVIVLACLVEVGQYLSGTVPFQPIDLVAAAASSVAVALVWDAGRRAVRTPPA